MNLDSAFAVANLIGFVMIGVIWDVTPCTLIGICTAPTMGKMVRHLLVM
jgi:hypothetical protein